MSDLHEIMYISQRRLSLTDTDVVDGIVIPAGRANRRLDITGCIWFDARRFVQILEGPRDPMQALYIRIKNDDRHDAIETLHDAPLASRNFHRWGMRALRQPEFETIEDVLRRHAPECVPPQVSVPMRKGLVGSIRHLLEHRARTEPPAAAASTS